MAENKMEQVAALFGKKLDEEFKLKFTFLPWNRIHTVKFTMRGLECLNTGDEWEPVSCVIPSLLIGTAEIVEDER